jgi:hypothetical protein
MSDVDAFYFRSMAISVTWLATGQIDLSVQMRSAAEANRQREMAGLPH